MRLAAAAVALVAGLASFPAAAVAAPSAVTAWYVYGSLPSGLLQVRNGWLVSDGRTLVAVYASAAGDDPSVGRLVVVRQDLVAGRQTVRTIDAGATGALAIVAAPLGSSVETSAQTGNILIRTSAGRALRLDLGTGTVGSG